jgi:hypothetical protein
LIKWQKIFQKLGKFGKIAKLLNKIFQKLGKFEKIAKLLNKIFQKLGKFGKIINSIQNYYFLKFSQIFQILGK